MADERCLLCRSRARVVLAAQPGYRAPNTYEICHCGTCDTSFSVPHRVDTEVYELIYARPEALPGYGRYARFAEIVRRSPQPLAALAGMEDTYWAVADRLVHRRRVQREPVRVLEVGSGLGYLTYALAKEGCEATGIDVSSAAVGAARRTFGDLYECATPATLARDASARYDLVVATELIEHLPDPVAEMRGLLSLLAPGGELIVTTPNKSFFPSSVAWHTEPPPVHLWWFSERSLAFIADLLGCGLTLVDYAPFYRNRYHAYPTRFPDSIPTEGHRLAEDGTPIAPVAAASAGTGSRRALARALELVGVTQGFRVARDRMKGHRRLGTTSTTLCAVLDDVSVERTDTGTWAEMA